MFLCIQNRGIAPTEAFTLLGASTSRDDNTAGVIGQFGTGAKHAINVILRAGLKLRVYCDKTRLEFFARKDVMSDDLGEKEVQRVCVKYGGTSTRTDDLGWVLDFGAIDWTELGMALREFVSNALDRTIRGGQDVSKAQEVNDLSVTVVEETEMRAKGGYTRIYVEASEKVLVYLDELGQRFLHFSADPGEAKMDLLPKADRNLTEGSRAAMIYRNGVFVTELKETSSQSVYDYNFHGSELSIDDCRNSNEYAIRAACAKKLRQASAEDLVLVFNALQSGDQRFETNLDAYYMLPSWETAKEPEQEAWKAAWEATAGESVLLEEGNHAVAELVQRKGHKMTSLPSNWIETATRMGIPTALDILSDPEKKGREVITATPSAWKAVNTVWGWIQNANLTQGKEQPSVECFRDITDAETVCLGFYTHGEDTVHLRQDIASGGVNKMLLRVALEMVARYITGSESDSCDLQDFLADLSIEALA
jgi:hypothetical protein